TAAFCLAAKGHRVRVFEALPEPGGMLRYGIPGYRLPSEILNRDISFITGHGVEIVTNAGVEYPETLMADGFDAVLITVGAWKSLKMGIEGEKSDRVLEGVAFLKAVNSGNPPVVGRSVVVVGGGNTAVDAARSVIRLGSRVTLLYRRTLTQMPAHPAEIKAALEEGVEIKILAVPVKVNPDSVTCVKTTLDAADDSHRPAPLPVEGSEFEVVCDTVIMAVGQTVDAGSFNLELNANGTIKVGPELETPTKGLFAAGDAVTGPSAIVEAIAQGRLVGKSIDRFLGGTGEIEDACDGEGRLEVPEEVPRGTYRPQVENIPSMKRVDGFSLVEPGFDRDMAIKEAGRCLACDARDFNVAVNDKICKGCGYCKEACALDIFTISDSFNSQGYKPAGVQSSDHCVGCLKCLYICPDFAINIEKIG
ncbi:MAG: FAD-dependent oxidoreductase, partial [Firmicutes bacterium]|nr:FAD-dependent oxidoreductase [Bacillota bacterium]